MGGLSFLFQPPLVVGGGKEGENINDYFPRLRRAKKGKEKGRIREGKRQLVSLGKIPPMGKNRLFFEYFLASERGSSPHFRRGRKFELSGLLSDPERPNMAVTAALGAAAKLSCLPLRRVFGAWVRISTKLHLPQKSNRILRESEEKYLNSGEIRLAIETIKLSFVPFWRIFHIFHFFSTLTSSFQKRQSEFRLFPFFFDLPTNHTIFSKQFACEFIIALPFPSSPYQTQRERETLSRLLLPTVGKKLHFRRCQISPK